MKINVGFWFGFAFGWALGRVLSLSLSQEISRGVEITNYLIIMGLIVVGFIYLFKDNKK